MRIHTIYLLLLLLFTLVSTGEVYSRPVFADLSLRAIKIDSSFKGTDILLFGARNDAGDVVIVIRGPQHSYVVRKKESVAGIWVNRKQATFENVNGYYALASSVPLEKIRNEALLDSLNIKIDNLDWKVKTISSDVKVEDFQTALVEAKLKDELYSNVDVSVNFIGETLFRSVIRFPEKIPRGVYTAEVYLFSDGTLVGFQSTPLIVSKTGFDAFIYNAAYQHSFIYGIVAVLIALVAGWIAGVIFRKT